MLKLSSRLFPLAALIRRLPDEHLLSFVHTYVASNAFNYYKYLLYINLFYNKIVSPQRIFFTIDYSL